MTVHLEYPDLSRRGVFSIMVTMVFVRTWDEVIPIVSTVGLRCESHEEAIRWLDVVTSENLVQPKGLATTIQPNLDGSATLHFAWVGRIDPYWRHSGILDHLRAISTYSYRRFMRFVSVIFGDEKDVLAPHVESLFQQHALPTMMMERLRVAHNLMTIKGLTPPWRNPTSQWLCYTTSKILVEDDTPTHTLLSGEPSIRQMSPRLSDHLLNTYHKPPLLNDW